VKVDAEEWREAKRVKGPLFVGEWKPALYSDGIHYIHVCGTGIGDN